MSLSEFAWTFTLHATPPGETKPRIVSKQIVPTHALQSARFSHDLLKAHVDSLFDGLLKFMEKHVRDEIVRPKDTTP